MTSQELTKEERTIDLRYLTSISATSWKIGERWNKHIDWLESRLAELEQLLLTNVQAWICRKCRTAFPKPHYEGFRCLECPRCGASELVTKSTDEILTLQECLAEREKELFKLGNSTSAAIADLKAKLAKREKELATYNELLDQYCGETGVTEGAVDTLERKLKELAELKIQIKMLLTEDEGYTHMYKFIEENDALRKKLAEAKRKADALDKLDRFINNGVIVSFIRNKTEVTIDRCGGFQDYQTTALTLLEAIEKAEQEKGK